MNITKEAVCPDCGSRNVEHLGLDSGSHEDLYECLDCGHVGCCDSSKNKHATKHFHATKHPVMRSIEPGETWGWCYVDEVMVDLA